MSDQRLAVLSFSGGMDSTTLAGIYHSRGYDLLLLSFNYGQRHGGREISAARSVASFYGARHHVIDLTSLSGLLPGSALTDESVAVPDGHYAEESMRITVVPNRNAIMANIAIGVASAHRADIFALGIHAGDHAVYPDCRPEFFRALIECAARALDGFHLPVIVAPFIESTKAEIARIGHDIKAPLGLSWSCYKGGAVHCGTCGTCVERREAFELAGVSDPTEYATAGV